ncbi:hypothetical protein D3C71_1684210 [compost metagenome]
MAADAVHTASTGCRYRTSGYGHSRVGVDTLATLKIIPIRIHRQGLAAHSRHLSAFNSQDAGGLRETPANKLDTPAAAPGDRS